MDPQPRPRRASKVAFTWTAQLLVYLALWFIFSGAFNKAELLAGLLGSAIAATLGELVWSQPIAQFVGDVRLLGQIWRLPWYAVRGTWEILVVLARHATGTPAPSVLRAVRFDAGKPDDPTDATRRALAVAYTTAAPNFLVLGVDQERNLLLFHQIKPGEVLQMTRNLGAKP